MNTALRDAELLELKEVLALLKIGKTRFYQSIAEGIFPQPLKIGNCSRWRAIDLKGAVDKLGNLEQSQPDN